MLSCSLASQSNSAKFTLPLPCHMCKPAPLTLGMWMRGTTMHLQHSGQQNTDCMHPTQKGTIFSHQQEAPHLLS